MTYFTDSSYEKMMTQKPQYGQGRKAPAPAALAKDKPTKNEQKIRKLIIVHENTGTMKQDMEGK